MVYSVGNIGAGVGSSPLASRFRMGIEREFFAGGRTRRRALMPRHRFRNN